MATITINGRKITGDIVGKNITIARGKVFLDGSEVGEVKAEGETKLTVEGDLASLKCDCDVIVNGNIKGDVDAANVTCGDVGGDIDAANVKCGKVSGDVDAVNVVTL